MNFISSIVNEYPGKFLVSRSSIADFNNGTILTVNPGEQAIFVNNGEIAATFTNGRYELNTHNYPFLNAFRRFLANGQLTYHCMIYYVSETVSAEVLWGFPLSVRDPKQNIYTKIFCRGAYTLRVKDAGVLLLQLLGMNINFMAAADLKMFYGNKFQQYISNLIAKHINEGDKEVLAVCAENIAVSAAIEPGLARMVAPVGLQLENFSISALQIDENDPNRRILEQAYAKTREMQIMGENYSTIKQTDVMLNASQTPFAGPSIGNWGFAQVQSSQTYGISNQSPRSPMHQPTAAQGGIVNTDNPAYDGSNESDFVKRLQDLQKMLASGLITEEDYNSCKARILNEMA